MSGSDFVHLHAHSEYSLLDGACRFSSLIDRAVELGMPAVALTDHGVMYGNISFYSEAKNAGIKPILGCEVYVAPRQRTQRDPRLDREQYHLVLLAKNVHGYKNLIKLVSTAFSEGFYYKPRVDKELLSRYGQDLIALTACLGGEVPYHILRDNMKAAEASVGEYVDIFGRDNFYLELMDHLLPEQKPVNQALINLSKRMNLKLVATNDIHYVTRSDAEPHDVLLCIQTGSTLDDPKRMKFGTKEFYMKSAEEMKILFSEVPESLSNTMEVAEKCSCEFDFGRSKLPNPGVPEGLEAGEYMSSEARKGLTARLGGKIPEIYEKQLQYECDVINKCGFAIYMLIVRDFTDFARNNDIQIGVRGSAAASLVCYGLGSTDVDPIEYGLAFERFLNPERKEMPDFDLDIQDDRRDELIQYVIEKYGRDRVGQIATFGSLKARAAVRDCGRVLGISLPEVDRICKMIPTIPVGVTIDQAVESNPELREAYNRSDDVKRLLDTAKSLEGLIRNVGIHAAGLLISDDPLTDHVPVQKGNKGEAVAQLAKKDIQKIGLLKMDFLGLANLTILSEAVENVKRSLGITIEIMNIPLDDPKTFEMLGRGDTNGVFQLESAGMRRSVIDLKPSSVRELAAIVALYRPGPMAFISNYVRSKFGQQKIEYLHPLLQPILEETYGVICYQEQVLSIARAIAGFTLGQADVLRKGMSSKNKAIMDEQRAKFLEGAKKNGIDYEIAIKICDQIEPFAGYAFNKAHAVCYAFLAYRTAYMKANYPSEYYSALLSANMNDKDKLGQYIEDCRRLNIEVLPPDVNSSGAAFEVQNGAIRFGLAAIKNVGRGVIDAIIASRGEGGTFKSLHEFCRRVCDSLVNRSTIESLIKAGAFDSMNSNRAQLLFVLEDAVSSAAKAQRDKQIGQTALFAEYTDDDLNSEPVILPQVTDMPQEEKRAHEKDLLGLYLSHHPLLEYKEKLTNAVNTTSDQLKEKAERVKVVVGGVISRIRSLTTKKNEQMAFITLEDYSGPIDVTVFPNVYKEYKKFLSNEAIVIIKGRANHRARIGGDDSDSSGEVGVICESVTLLSNGQNGNGNSTSDNGEEQKYLNIRIGSADRSRLRSLREALSSSPGECKVYCHFPSNGSVVKVCLDIQVDPCPKLISQIEYILKSKQVTW